jgi:large subunit ribosomal protein L32
MGAAPKSKIGPRRKRLRRTHYKAKLPTLVPCTTCGKMQRPHHVCLACGSYRGVEVLKIDDAKA